MEDYDHRCGEIVSNFLLRTCLGLRRRLNYHKILALTLCALTSDAISYGFWKLLSRFRSRCVVRNRGSFDDAEVALIPLCTGSIAEFYIQPILSCVSDVDIMYHHSDQLAIPEGTAPPTHLPADFHSHVEVFDILDSEFPGYVYLQECYLLTECSNDGSYSAERCQRQYASWIRNICSDEEVHGPAIVTDLPRLNRTMDEVYCIRCLSWPSQAADWSTRHRNYGWPDSATVDRIVSNGCDVVRVAHQQCRQHEWMGHSLAQWRLSFSRAEIILLNSWLPVQQIVYHMLRVFMKTQQLTEIRPTDDAGAKMFSNYNLKTLMMWACGRKPRSWWTDDMNVVRICVELLHTLGVSLTNARCQHYFIHNCNLMDHNIT